MSQRQGASLNALGRRQRAAKVGVGVESRQVIQLQAMHIVMQQQFHNGQVLVMYTIVSLIHAGTQVFLGIELMAMGEGRAHEDVMGVVLTMIGLIKVFLRKVKVHGISVNLIQVGMEGM